MRWAGHVACMGRKGMYSGFGAENMKKIDRLKNLGVNGSMVLKEILKK